MNRMRMLRAERILSLENLERVENKLNFHENNYISIFPTSEFLRHENHYISIFITLEFLCYKNHYISILSHKNSYVTKIET